MAQQLHAQLLTTAARGILRPLGLRQRGRSRIWLDDHGWWLVVVEFQPSSWSKGSYLNVGAMWLWQEKDYFSFDDGCRVAGFSAFIDEAQFAPIADNLSRRAAEEVGRYRLRYPSIDDTAQLLAARSPMGFWDTFHAAMACGLSGNVVAARRFFEEVAATDDPRNWAQVAAALAREYSQELSDLAGFRDRIKEVIFRERCLLKLGDLTDIEFE